MSGDLEDLGEAGHGMSEERWRKRQGLEPSDRVFVVKGRYPDLCEALVERGWKRNPDADSPWFDLKWTVKSRDAFIDRRWPAGRGAPANPADRLRPSQQVNHFARASRITSKVGLLHSLRALRWFEPVDTASFFPRCYDLARPGQYAEFVDEFRATAALSNVVRVVRRGLGAEEDTSWDWVELATDAAASEAAEAAPSGPRTTASAAVLLVSLRVCERRLSRASNTASSLDAPVPRREAATGAARACVAVSPASGAVARRCEWEVLLHCSVDEAGGPRERALAGVGAALPEEDDDEDDDEDDEGKGGDDDDDDDGGGDDGGGGGSDDDDGGGGGGGTPASRAAASGSSSPSRRARRAAAPSAAGTSSRGSVLQRRAWQEQMASHGWTAEAFEDYDPSPDPAASGDDVTVRPDAAGGDDVSFDVLPVGESVWRRCVRVLAATAARPGCQSTLDATPPRNVWIVKPAGLSRGRGIRCMSSLASIVTRRSGGSNRKGTYVVQKYIERPLLLRGRKFDIRQWVLVTSWNPLTVWFYADSYLRFCVRPFSLDREALSDRFVHLANNSVQKHAAEFSASGIEGNMWGSDDFAGWLRERYPPGGGRPDGVPADADVWHGWLRPRIEQTVVLALKAAQDMVDSHPGSFELYGYDFMVDSSLRPWLIEINSSPDMSYSTPVTERLVKQGLADVVKVVVDHRDAAARRRPRAARRREEAMAAAAVTAESPPGTPPPEAAGAEDPPGGFVSPLGVNTGRWKLAYEASRAVTRPLGGLPHSFGAEGEALFPPRSAGAATYAVKGRPLGP